MERRANTTDQMAVSVPATKATLLGGVAVALILLAVGTPTHSQWVTAIGAFLLALSAFWGGLFLAAEHIALRVVLVAVGGFVAVSAFLGVATSLTSLLR